MACAVNFACLLVLFAAALADVKMSKTAVYQVSGDVTRELCLLYGTLTPSCIMILQADGSCHSKTKCSNEC